MPTYEYKCDACGHAFEKFQSMSSPTVKKCPVCGKLKVKRLLGTGAGLIFKGSGFYITDYRSESYKSGEKGEKPASTETKSDPKSETKSESKSSESGGSGNSKPASEPKPSAPAKSESKPPKKSK